MTSEGHLYSSHLLNVTVNASDASLKSSQFPIRDRRLSIFGSDTRTICPVSALPWRAIGEISMSDNTGQYICSGAMVGSDAVLTAAHCVYSRSNQAFFSTLSFAPGQSASQAPYGTIPWAHVTIYSNYASSSIPDPNIYDIAVIKLTQQVGTTTGWLGVEIPCQAPDQGSFSLVTAGYPDDKPFGTCVTAGCRVTYNSCTNPYLYHECPTVDGQSGSAMWDPASGSPPKIKAVHNLQWQSSNGATIYNSAVAVTPLHYQAIISWIGSSAKQQIGHRDISTTNNPHPPSYP